MEAFRFINDPGTIKELAVDGCTDVFRRVHPNADPGPFREGLQTRTADEVQAIADRLAARVNHREVAKNGTGKNGTIFEASK